MRDTCIQIRPFNLRSITSYSGVQQCNEHAHAKFTGIINSDMDNDAIDKMLLNEFAEVIISGEDGTEETIFSGVVSNATVKNENGLRQISATIKSSTVLLDNRIHTRTFQNPAITYNEIIAEVTKPYTSPLFLFPLDSTKPIDAVVIQYEETDWQFLMRMASHFNSVIIPNNVRQNISFSFGVQNSPVVMTINSNSYQIERNFEEHERKIQNGLQGLIDADSIDYIIKNRESLHLGDGVTLNGKKRLVSKIETFLDGAELYHYYYLKTENGFKVHKIFNEKQIGASLDGTVTAIQKDQVQMQVHCDESECCGVNWFAYSTVFSSPDGTGWYCMPENGDAVRLYIPDRDEGHSYVVSSTHLEPSDAAQRSNPDHKSILNVSGKEILLTPNALILSNNNKMSVEIWDEEGIRIISDKEILIDATDGITIASAKGSLNLIADEEILLTQQSTNVTLNQNVTLGGSQVRIE